MSELEKMLQREVLPVDTNIPEKPEMQQKITEAQALFQHVVDDITLQKIENNALKLH